MEIDLTRGKSAIVDDEDFDSVRGLRWVALCCRGKWYAAFYYKDDANKNRVITMHRFLLGLNPMDGKEVDHVDGNGLNNKRSNLRLCSHAENTRNRKISKSNKCGFKGVYLAGERGFRARIVVNHSRVHLGYFGSAIAAHEAYKGAMTKYHGEFSNDGARSLE